MYQQAYPGYAPTQVPFGPQGFPNYAPNNGFGYGPKPTPKNTQGLTPEQINKFRQGQNGFDWRVDQDELTKTACTHKEAGSGNSTLVPVENHERDRRFPDQKKHGDMCTCTICGETFRMFTGSVDDVQNAVDVVNDMLQSSKAVYLDAPENFVQAYYQIVPLMKKAPKLWDRAMQNFRNYEQYQNAPGVPVYSNYYGGGNAFQMYQNLLYTPVNQGFPGYPQQAPQQQYAYQPQQQAPGYPQAAPAYDPNVYAQQQQMGGYPQMPNYAQPQQAPATFNPYPGMNGMPGQGYDANPFAYGMPPNPVTPPVAPPVGANPQQAPAPQQQAVPTNDGEVSQTKQFTV